LGFGGHDANNEYMMPRGGAEIKNDEEWIWVEQYDAPYWSEYTVEHM